MRSARSHKFANPNTPKNRKIAGSLLSPLRARDDAQTALPPAPPAPNAQHDPVLLLVVRAISG
jgi:hypothetical protein